VSRYGVIAMGSSWDCPGTLTLSVEDAALILGKIAGKDPYDATSIDAPVDNFLEAIKEKRSYTIGIVEDYFDGIDDDVRKAIDKSIKVFEGLGHKIKRIKLMSPDYSISVYTILQRAEVSSNLGRYDGVRYGNNRSAFGNEAKKRSMLGAYVLAHGYYDQFYKRGQKVRTLIIEDFKKAFKEVDILLAPTTPGTALKLGESDKYPFFGELMDKLLEPASAAGLPAISIPCGLDSKEMPIGMQLVGNYLHESDVMNLAYQFEKETSYFGVIEKGLQKWK
ncbi:Asp-tRNA(Asn)/Glu-tRNA(Gln) amidotransferase subunit GatA, partial [Candidatus Dojkabacteria bacterium]|nr:Asp-tRNA(Asn)/Glu-tRNA(Gln) amidotransferase subunit GatA [Candidatus Dojkabacteria bacterium]